MLEDGDDVYVRSGVAEVTQVTDAFVTSTSAKAAAPTPVVSSASESTSAPEVLCRNFGCNKKFREEDNTDTACKFHDKPPIFHETRKGWSCCSHRLVWDWDEFMKIEGCRIGRHSTVDPKVRFAPSPTVALAATAAASDASSGIGAPVPATAPRLKSVEDFNKENPNAVTAASVMSEMVTGGPKKPARTDGKAKCVHNGCKAEFVVADNNDSACRYHKGAPVFHDTGKYWSCCASQVKYDFDEFLAVPPCMTGPHEE